MRKWIAVGFGVYLAAVSPSVAIAGDELPRGTNAQRDVVYARPDGLPLKLDLYVPRGRKPVPLIIWIHGGGWSEGSKDDSPALPLLYRGYAVASVEYRLTKRAPFPAQIHDVKAAVRFLRANAGRYRLDPDRFGVWGESAGGHLAALLGVTSAGGELEGTEGVTGVSSRVQAVCDWYGPSDLARINVGRLEPGMSGREADAAVARLLGVPARSDPALAARASPLTYVTPSAPPFFIMHGDEDEVVPLSQSERLADALRRVDVDVWFKVIKGANHAEEDFYTPRQLGRVRAFFDRYLKEGGDS